MYDIRPNTGVDGLTSVAMHYGDQLAAGIQQTGQIIEQGLQRISTNRQIQAFGETISQIDPKTPDYIQKLTAIAPQFPLALGDPRGQTLVVLGAKEHANWVQGQNAVAKAQVGFQNQKGLIDYRNANRPPGEAGVDMRNMPGVTPPDQLTQQNPATNSGFSFGAGQDGVNAGAGSQVPLAGMNGSLSDNSGGEPSLGTPVDFQPVGKPTSPGTAPVDPLMQRAFDPLRKAQDLTGVKPKASVVFGALARTGSQMQQEKQQEDRQAQQDKIQADAAARQAAVQKELNDRLTKRENHSDQAKLDSEQNSDRVRKEQAQQVAKLTVLKGKLAASQKDVDAAVKDLRAHLIDPADELKKDAKDVYFSKKKELQKAVEDASRGLKGIEDQILATGGEPGVMPTGAGKRLIYDPASGTMRPQ